MAVMALPRQIIYAENEDKDPHTADGPKTSLKCNEFTFDATQSNLPESPDISYLWDFGDGKTSTEPVVTYVYKESGDYTVKLSVTDNSGFECSTAVTSQTVRVNMPPHASFVSEDKACVNEPVSYDANASYDDIAKELTYAWNFGDGTVLEGSPRVKKAYLKGGDYRIQLTTDDQSATTCSRATAEKLIHINEAPIAEAGPELILKCIGENEDIAVNFDASASKDTNNDPLTYIWDFGDGFKGKGIEIAHQYKQVGNYDVRLIVSDNTGLNCGTDVDFITVKLSKAPQARAGDDVITCAGEEVRFDGSESYVYTKGTGMAQWFFGDSSSADGLIVTHRYERAGTYQATLSLEDKLNAMCPVSRDTRVVTVNSPPSVSIKSLNSECVGKEIFFDASSSVDPDGDNLEYYWNFGDGTTAQGKAKVSHKYAQGGDYRVNVIVDDKKGTSCSSKSADITVHINTPPIADAGPNLSCCVEKVSQFTAGASSDPDGDQLSYTWDFGDGSKAKGETVTHAYSRSGSYNVVLTVDDNSASSCSQSTDGFVADVRKTPSPIITIR
jgi:PKD repeat protein